MLHGDSPHPPPRRGFSQTIPAHPRGQSCLHLRPDASVCGWPRPPPSNTKPFGWVVVCVGGGPPRSWPFSRLSPPSLYTAHAYEHARHRIRVTWAVPGSSWDSFNRISLNCDHQAYKTHCISALVAFWSLGDVLLKKSFGRRCRVGLCTWCKKVHIESNSYHSVRIMFVKQVGSQPIVRLFNLVSALPAL